MADKAVRLVIIVSLPRRPVELAALLCHEVGAVSLARDTIIVCYRLSGKHEWAAAPRS
jgi:hypothetical protein